MDEDNSNQNAPSDEESRDGYFEAMSIDDKVSRSSDIKHISNSTDSPVIQHYDDEVSQQSHPLEGADYVEYTGEGSQDSEKEKVGTQSTKHDKVDSTLYMSGIQDSWDDDFIKQAFAHFDYKVLNVKMIRDKGRPFAFIELESPEIAKKVLLKINGRTIPNDPDRRKFNICYSVKPNELRTEYYLSVSNLSSSVKDADLFKLFAEKYASCRGAQVMTYQDGQSKRYGSVKFINQTDQQLALVEMHKYVFKGREMILKLGPTKTKGPKHLMANLAPQGSQFGGYMQSGIFPSGNSQFGSSMTGINNPFGPNTTERSAYRTRDGGMRIRTPDRGGDRKGEDRDRSRSRRGRRDSPRRSRSTSKERKRRYWKLDEFVKDNRQKALYEPIYYPPYVEDHHPWPVDEYNEEFVRQSEQGSMDLSSGKYSDFIVAPNWRLDDVVKHLYSEALVPSEY
ncbi:hypothetical protein FO519_005343 [Halicephalobus sp. NKZ332]|nr:hypothetical protein FO519_005343 [Halicephalobus sp. NKZ332]